jgi:hypothetical protein
MENVSGQYISNSAIGLLSPAAKDMAMAREVYRRTRAMLPPA